MDLVASLFVKAKTNNLLVIEAGQPITPSVKLLECLYTVLELEKANFATLMAKYGISTMLANLSCLQPPLPEAKLVPLFSLFSQFLLYCPTKNVELPPVDTLTHHLLDLLTTKPPLTIMPEETFFRLTCENLLLVNALDPLPQMLYHISKREFFILGRNCANIVIHVAHSYIHILRIRNDCQQNTPTIRILAKK